MTIREKIREIKNNVKRRARDTFAGGIADPVPSSSSSPNIAPHNSPLPESHAKQTQFSPSAHSKQSASAHTPPAVEPGRAIIGDSWAHLKGFTKILDQCTSGFRPLKEVVSEFLQCIEIHESVAKGRRDYQVLKVELEALFKDPSGYFSGNLPPAITTSVENLCRTIANELHHITDKEDRNMTRRYLESTQDLDDIIECYRRIQSHLERLKLNTDLSIWRAMDESTTEARLNKIGAAMSARYNSAEAALIRRRECTPKTREQVLTELKDWRQDKLGGKIFWMSGMAGVGKTTIANSLCVTLDRECGLGASFFCSRLLPECRNINLLLPTIAYQLARFSTPFRGALSQVLQRDPDIHTQSLTNQFEGMIVRPLSEVAHTLPVDIVVVIDALDECEDDEGTAQILDLLLAHTSDLPVKFFLSSRPEPQIRRKIGSAQSQLILHELDEKIVKEDIETYLRAELAAMSLSEGQLMALVDRAGVLFIYAATVVRYVGAGNFSLDPDKRLEAVLGAPTSTASNKNKDIDALYSTVLASAFENPDLEDSDRWRMKIVLYSVVCAQEPLTVGALVGLLHLDNERQVHAALQPMWSVLNISAASDLVTPLHASFPDYILDPKRSKGYGCNAETHHSKLAELCFDRIKRNERQFNICELESSYAFDEQVPDLDERAKRAIPSDLLYASQYWATHLEAGEKSNRHAPLLLGFLSERLLLWMEVLNLRKRMDLGGMLLEQARRWCTSADCSQELKELAQDAWRFVIMFAAHPVSRSTPHIYTSILASWPRSHPIAAYYISRTVGLVGITGPGTTRRQLALLGMFHTNDTIRCVNFSPDGTRIAAGSDDNTVCVLDAQTGRTVLGPLNGHGGLIYSVAFSPDGTRIASASKDNTIRIWDARTGRTVLNPLRGHTGDVNSVAFSPDGTRIVSGSDDRTIMLWNVQTGEIVLGPLARHTNWIYSVSFSPDGTRIVSGSKDKHIFVWDARTGDIILDSFQGHTADVNSVAFSPDGTRIISSSDDETVILWDAQTGQMVANPLQCIGPVYWVAFSPNGRHFAAGSGDSVIRVWEVSGGQVAGVSSLEGHTRAVYSVAFSPDGTRIISGSEDRTVCVWDVQGGRKTVDPLEGHTGYVLCLALSSNGALIASGSADMTIHAWDAQTGRLILGPLKGHAGLIRSIAFSPDNTHIFSGSSDKTMRSWDAQTGHPVLGPLQGHTADVISIALSPDGTRLVSGSDDQTICVWDVPSGKMLLGPLRGHNEGINSVAFSLDGARIISGSYDKTIQVRDARSGSSVARPLRLGGGINPMAFSLDGTRIASSFGDGGIAMWDAQTGQMIGESLQVYNDEVISVSFSPDGTRIAAGSTERTISIWTVQTGKMAGEILAGHTGSVCAIAFSSDGTSIISGSTDGTIRAWVASGTQTPKQHKESPNDQVGDVDTPSWTVDDNGWVLDSESRLLLWLPSDLRTALLRPQNLFLISRRGSINLDFANSMIGETWGNCYIPSSS